MSEQQWYIYHQSKQMGPFLAQQVINMVTNNIITQEAYVFKVGWKDWRPLEETLGDLGMKNATPVAEEDTLNRRNGAPRASVQGRIIVHNNGQLVIGKGVNISSTGIFVETQSKIFKLGERLKLTCRIDDFSKQFNSIAEVIRRNTDTRYAIGYGLKFELIDERIQQEIQTLVDRKNRNRVS